jgi:hypothetical protein
LTCQHLDQKHDNSTTLVIDPCRPVRQTKVTRTEPAILSRRVEELVDRAPDLAALTAHRLQLAAARIWRSRGLTIPPELRRQRQQQAIARMVTSVLLKRVRAAYDGQLLLMKGPEVAAWYEHPADRGFRDLDILADDAPAAQRALVAAGFVEHRDPGYYADKQHLCPLISPGIALVVEIHRRPNRPAWLPQVQAHQVLELGVPSATGVAGILAPSPGTHALLLAAHSFAHSSMGHLRDVVDVAAVMGGDTSGESEAIAREWDWEGLWQLSHAAVDALLTGEDAPRVLGGHLRTARERTVFENHVARTAAPVYALPKRRVVRAVTGVMIDTLSPSEDESWPHKLWRSSLAVVHARMPTSKHEQASPQRQS